MQKVLITGSAGYLGSHAAVEFIEAGYDPVGCDNYLNSEPSTYDRIFEITGIRIPHYDIDLRERSAVNRIFEDHSDIEAVIHFAALKSIPDSVNNPLFCFENNNGSLVNLLKACEKYGVKHFVYSSSCSVYGNVTADELPVDENTSLKEPESPYGYTKQNGEYLLSAQSKVKPLKGCSLRYFNPVGAHKSGELGELPSKRVNNLVPVITQSAGGVIDAFTVYGSDYNTRDGSCIRDYIHVSDIARAHVSALRYLQNVNADHFYDVINLGSGEGVSVFEVIKAFEKATGEKARYEIGDRRPGDVEAIYSDRTKAEKLLGWKPEFSLYDMMNTAWLWQQKLKKLGKAVHRL